MAAPCEDGRLGGLVLPFSADYGFDAELPEEATYWTPGPEYPADEEDSLGYFHDVWPIVDIDHSRADATVAGERYVIEFVDFLSRDPAEFEGIATAIECGYPDTLPPGFSGRWQSAGIIEMVGDGEIPEPAFEGMELGVAGLVFALASIGCFPAASCRSHTERSWSPYPVVFFAADRDRASWLRLLVESAGCGFAVDRNRSDLLLIEGPSIRHTSDLADSIIEKSPNRRPDLLTRWPCRCVSRASHVRTPVEAVSHAPIRRTERSSAVSLPVATRMRSVALLSSADRRSRR